MTIVEAYLAPTLEAHAPDAFALGAGDRVDDMTIVSARSRGGFAQVYEARLARDAGRRIALKMLLPHVAMSHTAIERLRLEASVLAELEHSHVVEVFGCGEYRGAAYIAMEWIDGRSLADELATRGALPFATTLALFEQVCGAVSAAHARGIVHRDIKADNVMLVAREPLHVKLVDFGIAKLLRPGSPALTTSMQVLGTPIAMSPEQLLGKPIDERTDVYGLGVLLYQCLTGRPPYIGKNLVETEELHLSAEPPRATDRVDVPAPVDAVIRRALAKVPTARHPSVDAFLADLRDAFGERRGDRRGAAVYVEVRPAGSGIATDDDFDAIDRALFEASRVLQDAGFEILAEASNAILAAAALPGDGTELRRRALDAAHAIAQPRMRVQVYVAVDAFDGRSTDLGPAALAGMPPGVVER